METSFKTKLVYAILAVVVSGVGIYSMVEPLHRTATKRMMDHLENSKPGPFDEAMKKSLGLSDYPDNKKWTPTTYPMQTP